MTVNISGGDTPPLQMKIKPSQISAYFELTKPKIVAMVFVTLAIGFFMAPGPHDFWLFVATLIGTGLASAGAAALNHCLERDVDALMERTRDRPIPSGVIHPIHALIFGVVLVLVGVTFLELAVNLLTAFLVLLTAFLYVLVYTPLKRLSWLNTFVGAIPGALPPMIGWAAATGEMGFGAYILFLILFAWQHPHFYSLAWMLRDDYTRGGLQMLPVIDPTGRRTMFHILFYSLFLFVVSLVPVYFGMAGRTYFFGVLILGLVMLGMSIELALSRSLADARKLFRASLIYFPVLLVLVVIDSKF